MNRRDFLKSSVVAAAAGSAALTPSPAAVAAPAELPSGPAGPGPDDAASGQDWGRRVQPVDAGGNLIGGYAHSRDLDYVAHLMRRYNTDAKILETLELAEIHGINVMNSWVRDGITHLQQHWKRGGKMQWIAQARVTGDAGFDQFKQAADLGAVGIHVTGDVADELVRRGEIDTIARTLDLIRARKCLAGIGAHGLGTVVACERAKLNPDFYIKTFHSHDYYTAPRPDETGDLGRYDNSWCKDPEEVAEVMFTVRQPWIAFKVLAAGAIPPARGFRHAFEGGADFILVGMFDWQIEEDVRITKEVLGSLKRTRPWRG
ncbi:MAG: twin-arginine translocation signal domain-containing protein [Verrucomicrobia bacterium]|nr:twin-arginine translocation signal domain-containing protein [Verrucomicrobiota bacterium]